MKPRAHEGTAQTIFLLSKLCAVGVSKYHGARFSVLCEDSGRLIIQHEASVLWNYIDGNESPHTTGRIYTDCRQVEVLGKPEVEIILDIGACILAVIRAVGYSVSAD